MILKVYLYNFYRGKLLEYEGELLVRSKYQAIFRVLNKNGDIIRFLKCDPKPGVLYNRNVWFDEVRLELLIFSWTMSFPKSIN